MDDVDRIVVVEDEHDLERTAGWGPAPYQPLVVRPLERVRLPRDHHDVLGLFRLHAVASEVLHVPLVPSELGHTISYTRIGPDHQAGAIRPQCGRRSAVKSMMKGSGRSSDVCGEQLPMRQLLRCAAAGSAEVMRAARRNEVGW